MQAQDLSWAVPMSDLLSVLLAVFVMIAAMSELRPGTRFDRVGGSVRGAFGLSAGHGSVPSGQQAGHRPATWLNRLEAAGHASVLSVHLQDARDVRLPACEVRHEADRIAFRAGAGEGFTGVGTALSEPSRSLVREIGDYLKSGHGRIEIRGFGPEGKLPPASAYRDEVDLGYERARVVVKELLKAGVAGERIELTACSGGGVAGGFEIVVHAARAEPSVKGGTQEKANHDG